VRRSLLRSSLATATGLAVHYLLFLTGAHPLWTDVLAEWIMARTPSEYAVWLLATLGSWAKPFAATGGLATLGMAVWLGTSMGELTKAGARLVQTSILMVVALSMGLYFEYPSVAGQLSFWVPTWVVLLFWGRERGMPAPGRRAFLARAGKLVLPFVMGGATAGVALEAWLRNRALARRATEPVDLFPFRPPGDTFGEGLVRPAVTPVGQFYTMSKNTVDPVEDPATWRLLISLDGRPLRELRYEELLALPRQERYVTLRCISNTLTSNLMGNAIWSGIHLSQLVHRGSLPAEVVEVAVIGSDGHGDSLPLDYAFSEETMLALGMNGKTLTRAHGFPLRLLVPRYYGFKHVKWIREIAFRSAPYFGTWPKMGYTKEPRVHTMSYIDRAVRDGDRIRAGGIAFAGNRGIRRVLVRADGGGWHEARLEPPLSPYAWTRWRADLAAPSVTLIEAKALDGEGNWQASEEGPLFPSGVKGPTIRRIS
jgi:DMSO/TMAO reductase YedYZ molybdopterin-dependent catalytic subunit